MSIRVLVADDQDLVRTGLRMILDAQPGIEVVGEAADGRRPPDHGSGQLLPEKPEVNTNEGTIISTDRSARFWDRIAVRYAAKPVPDETVYERKLAITREYLNPQAKVLELGCGTGSTAIAHAPYVQQILATDISPKMIEIARGKATAAEIRNVDLECCAVDEVNLPDANLGAVLALSVLHLIENWCGAIVAAHRMLKPGGVLVSSTVCLDDGFSLMRLVAPAGRRLGVLPRLSFFTRKTLENTMISAGFQLEYSWQPAPRRGVFLVARKPS